MPEIHIISLATKGDNIFHNWKYGMLWLKQHLYLGPLRAMSAVVKKVGSLDLLLKDIESAGKKVYLDCSNENIEFSKFHIFQKLCVNDHWFPNRESPCLVKYNAVNLQE